MSHTAARTATRDRDAGRYQRHWPEQTFLYQIVEKYYPAFTAHLEERGSELPGYIDIETCAECGGSVTVIACIENPVVVQKILDHLKEKGAYQDAVRLPESRGPPLCWPFLRTGGQPVGAPTGGGAPECNKLPGKAALCQAVKWINGQARSKPETAGIGARPLGRLLDCL